MVPHELELVARTGAQTPLMNPGASTDVIEGAPHHGRMVVTGRLPVIAQIGMGIDVDDLKILVRFERANGLATGSRQKAAVALGGAERPNLDFGSALVSDDPRRTHTANGILRHLIPPIFERGRLRERSRRVSQGSELG